MATVERWREQVSEPPTAAEIREKAKQGWRLAAVEWQRQVPAAAAQELLETPYGLRTPAGDTELHRNREEEEALRLMLGMVIDDRNSLTAVAAELNRRGYRTRSGRSWSPTAVFDMLPRLVEVAPRFFARPDWAGEQATAH